MYNHLVNITPVQRKMLTEIWFTYGNGGRYHSHAGHRFIQCLLEQDVDRRLCFRPPQVVLDTVDGILNLSAHEKGKGTP